MKVPPVKIASPIRFKRVPEPLSSVPLVRVTVFAKLCVLPAPRFRVPPVPLIVSLDALTSLAKVAVPPVLAMVMVALLLNPAMLCVPVPVRVRLGTPVKAPEFTKLPLREMTE